MALAGGSGTIGSATLALLRARGERVIELTRAEFLDDRSVAEALRAGKPRALISCVASRTGLPGDAWEVDYQLNRRLLDAASRAGCAHFILLSAICVQKPRLAFQQAKLAFEGELMASGMRYSIVRPTAFFKSLSGQVERVRRGRRFLVFGDGRLTACKPIADEDLADYLLGCLEDPDRHNRVLPIGGPGPAITPLDQARLLEQLLGRTIPVRRVPVALLDAIVAGISGLSAVWPSLARKAELARIGRYYATESMLVWDETHQCPDDAATPEHGSRRLEDHYRALLAGQRGAGLADHAVFK